MILPITYSKVRDKITDWKKGTPDAKEIEEYTWGRIFDKNGELRWRKQSIGYALLWLSEGDLPAEFTTLGEWATSEPQAVSLLGGGETKPWRDTRIPRKLKYPMKWCQSPKINIIQYKESISHTIRFTRYMAFVRK